MVLTLAVPFFCALAFPWMALLLKRSMGAARDPWGALMVSNGMAALVFVPPFLLLEGWNGEFSREVFLPRFFSELYPPLLCGAFFFAGQIVAYKSFAVGDLSVAVPIQGIKVLLVALFAALFVGQPAGWNIWAAAGLTPVALFFLREHAPGKTEARRHGLTVLLGSAAAALFAAMDTGIQAWSESWGVWRFGFWTFSFQALLSLGLFFLPGRSRRFRYPGRVWGELLAGSLGMAAISLGLVWAISDSGRAAWVNILFNSRVLWSVLFAWAAGRFPFARFASWFREGGPRGRRILSSRLLGAGFMLAAIALAVL